MRQEALLHARLAFEADAEALADAARAAIATGQIAAADLLSRAVRRPQCRGHALLVLRDVFQLDAPSRLDHRRALHRALQHRLDLDLRNSHRRLARHGAVVAIGNKSPPVGDARIAEPVQLVAGQAGDPGHVEIAQLRHGDGAQRIYHAKPAEKLHAARIGDVHLRMSRGGRVAFHQQAGDAAPRQLARERHADGPAARDQNRDLLHSRSETAAALIG